MSTVILKGAYGIGFILTYPKLIMAAVDTEGIPQQTKSRPLTPFNGDWMGKV